MKRRFFAACALFTLAGCCILALRLLAAPRADRDLPAPTQLPARDGPTLAFFGASDDPWYASLADEVEDWARQRGWGLITYDCRNNPNIQKGQVQDLVGAEGADVAVLCTLDADNSQDGRTELAGRVGLLYDAQVPVITLSPQNGRAVSWKVKCHVGPQPEAPYLAAAGALRGSRGVLLVADLPEDSWVEEARQALEKQGVPVLHYGACWGSARYAADYVESALALYPDADGVLTASLAGALGAKSACPQAKVVRMGWDPETAQALALGELDGAVGVSPHRAMPALAEVLEGWAQGAEPDFYWLETDAFTPASADQW